VAVVLAAGCGSSPTAPVIIPPLSRVALSPETLVVHIGESLSFSADAYDTSGAHLGPIPFVWRTSDASGAVLSLNQSGRVTGRGEGTAIVSAEADSLRDSSVVIVVPQTRGWYSQVSNANGANLNGVFFLPDGRTGWAVGDAGKILRTTNAGVSWVAQSSGTLFSLESVWFVTAGDGWVVGASGTVLHTVDGGAHWNRVDAGSSEILKDVIFATDSIGWAVGSSGLVLSTTNRGTTWQRRFPTPGTLHSVSFAGTQDGWAVGDQGVIIGTHNGGSSWFVVQPAVTGLSLRSVWRRSAAKAFAAGTQGVAPRTITTPDSTAWTVENAGASNQLEGVHYPTDLIGFAVGFNGVGAVLRTDDGGVSWQPQTSNSQFRLNDVFFLDSGRGWAVGDNGTIIHTATGGMP